MQLFMSLTNRYTFHLFDRVYKYVDLSLVSEQASSTIRNVTQPLIPQPCHRSCRCVTTLQTPNHVLHNHEGHKPATDPSPNNLRRPPSSTGAAAVARDSSDAGRAGERGEHDAVGAHLPLVRTSRRIPRAASGRIQRDDQQHDADPVGGVEQLQRVVTGLGPGHTPGPHQLAAHRARRRPMARRRRQPQLRRPCHLPRRAKARPVQPDHEPGPAHLFPG